MRVAFDIPLVCFIPKPCGAKPSGIDAFLAKVRKVQQSYDGKSAEHQAHHAAWKNLGDALEKEIEATRNAKRVRPVVYAKRQVLDSVWWLGFIIDAKNPHAVEIVLHDRDPAHEPGEARYHDYRKDEDEERIVYRVKLGDVWYRVTNPKHVSEYPDFDAHVAPATRSACGKCGATDRPLFPDPWGGLDVCASCRQPRVTKPLGCDEEHAAEAHEDE